MTSDGESRARAVLCLLQAAVDSRDPHELLTLFEDEPAMLIGASGDGRTPALRKDYLTAVASQPERLFWDWHEVVGFYETEDVIGFAAFGDIVMVSEEGESRAPIRATLLAIETSGGWRIKQFHGSIPANFS
jgi:SnoaL-like protein